MNTRRFALGIGVVYVVVGILGFLPGIVQPPPAGAPDLAVDAGYGYLMGMFPINVAHNIVHLIIGILGIVSSDRLTLPGCSRAGSRSSTACSPSWA